MHSIYLDFHVLSHPWARALHSLREGARNSKCQRWLSPFIGFPRSGFLLNPCFFSFWLTCFSSSPRLPFPACVLVSFSLWSSQLLFLVNPHSHTHTSLHQDQPVLRKGCCHWEIACKCPGGLHQLLSYRDVKWFKLLTQMADPDSRATQLQLFHETLKRRCYWSVSSFPHLAPISTGLLG